MRGPFKVSVDQVGDVTLVKINGKMHGCPQHKELLYVPINDQLEQGHRKFVLDLSSTRFMDSIGVSYVEHIHESIANLDGELVACGLNERVLGVFHVVELEKLCRVFRSSKNAVGALADGQGRASAAN